MRSHSHFLHSRKWHRLREPLRWANFAGNAWVATLPCATLLLSLTLPMVGTDTWHECTMARPGKTRRRDDSESRFNSVARSNGVPNGTMQRRIAQEEHDMRQTLTRNRGVTPEVTERHEHQVILLAKLEVSGPK